MPVALLDAGPARARDVVVLAHGAGAPMDSEFMNVVADGLAAARVRVVRFEFPYMERRRSEGKRGGPDRQPLLLDRWREVVAQLRRPERLIIGGKSMGGRMASMVADELGVRGLVCMGYPFHPPGKPEKLRTEHLLELRTPTLILQGERDTFGTPDEIAGYGLSPAIALEVLADGDHSFKPRKRSGHTQEGHLSETVEAIARFAVGLRER